MRPWLRVLISLAVLAFFGVIVVAAVLPLNIIGFMAWAFCVRTMARGTYRANREGKSWVVYTSQVGGMIAIIWVAVLTPVKTVDHVKARQITLPNQSMRLDELANRFEPGLDRISGVHMSVPDPLGGKVVRFPSRDLTVGTFITTLEAQTPMRHRFSHCGNGWTILWGGDCSFGLHLRVPPAPLGG